MLFSTSNYGWDKFTGLTVKHILVDRANVENLDISDAEVIANDVTEELRSTGDYQPWNISISGYDDDPRALFEIPEIREWCKKCLDQIPYLLALLSQNTIDWFSLCVVDVNASGSGEDKLKVDMRITEEDANMLITSTMHAWKFFADCGINNEDAGKLAEQAQRRLPWFKNMPSH